MLEKLRFIGVWVLVILLIAIPITLCILGDFHTVETEIVGVEITRLDYSTSKSSANIHEKYIVAFRCDDFSGTAGITAEQYASLREGEIIKIERRTLENHFGDITYSFSYIGRLGET